MLAATAEDVDEQLQTYLRCWKVRNLRSCVSKIPCVQGRRVIEKGFGEKVLVQSGHSRKHVSPTKITTSQGVIKQTLT